MTAAAQSRRARRLICSCCAATSRSCVTRSARPSSRWRSPPTLPTPRSGSGSQWRREGAGAARRAECAVRLGELVEAVARTHVPECGDRGVGGRHGARDPAGSAGAGRGLPARAGSAGAGRVPVALRRCPVCRLAAAARPRARRHRPQLSPVVSHHRPRWPAPVLRPRLPRCRLDGAAVLVLLRLQRLAKRVPRCQRPRGRLGADNAVPLIGGQGRARAALGGLRAARLPRRGPSAALGRRRATAGGRRPSCGLRRCRVARVVLRARGVPGGARASVAALDARHRGCHRAAVRPQLRRCGRATSAADRLRRLRPR